MLIAIWQMGTNGCLYDDPGADYFTRLHPDTTPTQDRLAEVFNLHRSTDAKMRK